MNKQEYLKALKAALGVADKKEAARTMEFYSELIDDALEDGISEEEAVAGLEAPAEVAERIVSENGATERKRINMVLFIAAVVLASPIWLPVAVSVFAVIFSVYISLWAVIVSLMASSVGTAAGAIAGVAASVMILYKSGAADSLFMLGAAFATAGIAIYLIYLSVFAAKQYVRLSVLCLSSIRKKAGKRRASK